MEDLEAWRFGDGYQGESYRWKNLRLGGLESCQGDSPGGVMYAGARGLENLVGGS